MIINDKRKATTVNFKEIREGECFIYPEDGSVCMRIDDSVPEYNSVDLDNGQVFFVTNDTEVIKVNSRLEIW